MIARARGSHGSPLQETVANIRPLARRRASCTMGDIPLLEKIVLSSVRKQRHRSAGAHAIDASATQALSPLLIMGVLMLAVGRYDADLETLLPGVTERFAVAVGKAFVEDRDQLNAACSLIGVLKVLVVLNIWGLKNTRVQLILAAVAVPGFALVIYAHRRSAICPSAYMPAVVFMILLPKTAFAMLRGDEAEEPAAAVEAAPAPAPKSSGRTGKHKKRFGASPG